MKTKELFLLLRTLVRTGELRPAYARRIFRVHVEALGREIPAGMMAWFQHGHHYDNVVWGSREDKLFGICGEIPQRLRKPLFATGHVPHLP